MAAHLTHGTGAAGFAVCRERDAVPDALRRAVVAIGNFDGVHRGHQRLLEIAGEAARRAGRPAIVLTFEPHPRSFFAPDRPVFRLTPEPVKLAVLARLGLGGVVLRRFDGALAATSAQDFAQHLLFEELGAAAVVVGHDFHYGKGRQGTPATLAAFCAERGVPCHIVEAVSLAGEAISSSAVRRALEEGEIGRANRLLGYGWFVMGEVRHGEKRGRTLGYPTANLRLGEDSRLRHGIYAVRMALEAGRVLGGVASFGRRPTFDDGAPLLEIFAFDFSGDLYGREIQVEFVDWIRGEEKFDSAEALVRRMDEDSRQARERLVRAQGEGLPSMIG
ncbi:MAG: FMN adenylyltransferase / Riboflavin kinase [uncultured Microvirga sp.]|uniref:Riboflavin biosynthesis protein n=1 Tax=uncultured Microvirga sp. TaxID=412392 RepID=A0A6J4LKJ9_9HYPH|nr:MAG: FMN adenylyltransferase / Riboflavin kinase [uncultured Microvirga sp.]